MEPAILPDPGAVTFSLAERRSPSVLGRDSEAWGGTARARWAWGVGQGHLSGTEHPLWERVLEGARSRTGLGRSSEAGLRGGGCWVTPWSWGPDAAPHPQGHAGGAGLSAAPWGLSRDTRGRGSRGVLPAMGGPWQPPGTCVLLVLLLAHPMLRVSVPGEDGTAVGRGWAMSTADPCLGQPLQGPASPGEQHACGPGQWSGLPQHVSIPVPIPRAARPRGDAKPQPCELPAPLHPPRCFHRSFRGRIC